jgi:glycosyltransferase involved in cell wall biosynthesis
LITVITLTKNERAMIPFFLRHYARFADLIVVNDNDSSDGTREYAMSHPKTVVIPYSTGGVLRDDVHRDIKSNQYRTLPGEWFIIVDCDEFVWHPDMAGYLDRCYHAGITLPRVAGYNMVGPKNGIPDDDDRAQLTDLIPNGVRYPFYDKSAVVHKSIQINYMIGSHYANPTGRVLQSQDAEIKLLHYYWLSEEYRIVRTISTLKALSNENVANGWGEQPSVEELRQTYRKMAEEAVRVI